MNYRFWMFPKEDSGIDGNDLSNGGRGAGKAKELKDNLDGYIDWANKFRRKPFASRNGKAFQPATSFID